ncbi:RHS repeat-associated core domain-containing protein [Nonomuraea typhae]|uniref:RHS repeat-associated core domain-containing protein n=1 Tax=Nonomuraea typhae TaxID=2603600 RepID=UPI0012F7CBC8|nr:RHS repeat-associated core domain-containing protein [Nonomuraea typhae]
MTALRLVAAVLLILGLVQAPAVAAAAGGPSVPLPGTESTPVAPQAPLPPRAQDQAGAEALSGNQPAQGQPAQGGGTSYETPLQPSATWQVAGHTGDFSWSYPLRVPPAPGGAAPSLALGYSSSSVDGRTSATNNQASWAGDGWSLGAGFVERTYGACLADKEGGTVPPVVGDLCWRSDNAFATYPGGGGMLLKEAQGDKWRATSDDGSRIERLRGADNGDADKEYWKVTTPDGTQYFFGSRPGSGSTWTVPVFGDDAGEPCHAATFAASSCVQAWRWNLDKVVDRHGNLTYYTYETESNSYAFNAKDAAVPYTRGGWLKRIEYGLRDTPGAQPAARVEFTTADRCVPGSVCTPAMPQNWPDVPWAEKCDTPTCKDRYSPSFWTTKRLAKITTQVRRGAAFTDVDSWTLDHQFPKTGDGESPALWLKSITHTGHAGGNQSLPPVTFEGTKMPNRVSAGGGVAPLLRYRITGIVSETGGVTSVTYAEPDCGDGASMPASPQTNTLRCFPVRWAPPKHAERTDYFHKYVVAAITQSDWLSSSTEQVTRYSYLGGAAWHLDRSEFTPPDKRTWNEFRGFARTQIRAGKPGDPAGPLTKSEERYFRGMGGQAEDSEGVKRDDSEWLQGFRFENITYDGDTDTVVSKEITVPSAQGPTAQRGEYKAYIVRPGATTSYTTLAAGGRRTTRVTRAYDDRGLLVTTGDEGDTAKDDDDRCTRVTYVRNEAAWLLALPSRTQTVSTGCAKTPSFPADALADERTSYDGQDHGAPPVRGDATKTETLQSHPASGPVYTTTATTTFDERGRPTAVTDAAGSTTGTAYTQDAGGPTTQIAVTNALSHVTTTTLEPATGLPLKVVDQNGNVSETAYDALSRAVEVWLPGRYRQENEQGNHRLAYTVDKKSGMVVTTATLGPEGNYTTSNTIYDGLLRERQIQAPAPGGGRVLTDTRYDSQGRIYKVTKPYFNNGEVDGKLWVAADTEVASLTRTQFDGVGRPVAEIVMGGAHELWRTTMSYGGDRTHLTPPRGGTPATYVEDARGQTVELRQHKSATETDTATYAYDPAGRLTTVKNAAGATWRLGYDLRGSLVRQEHPDKGVTTMTHDRAGRVATITDARGGVLAYDYDALGRRTALHTGSATGPVTARWSYDTVPYGKGQPATSTRYLDGHAYTTAVLGYNERYQSTGLTYVIPESPRAEALAGTYVTRQKYNVDGSLKSTAFPAVGGLPGEVVVHGYDDAGRPTTTYGGLDGTATVDYVTDTRYTAYGEPARIQLGETGKRTWLSYYYDDHTRRVKRAIVDAELPKPMRSDVNYAYDPAGNITSIANTPRDLPADVQCFRYDGLRRLTEAWTPGNDCAAGPSAAGLSGAAPYWQSFTYDAAGNRATDTEHTSAGDTTRTYSYRPLSHTLTSVSTQAPAGAPASVSFAYDEAGNTVGRPAQTLDWDALGNLAKATLNGRSTEFVHGADGERLLRQDPDGITLYLPGQEVRLPRTGQATATRSYTHGKQTVATRTTAGLTWLAGDHQGTLSMAIDATTLAVTERRQTPFGAPRGAASSFPGEKGFVGGTIDAAAGLVTLGARPYDPAYGRFLSVDPIMDVATPQQFNAYAYANNSPVTLSDPTGLRPDDQPGYCVIWRGDCGFHPTDSGHVRNGFYTPDQVKKLTRWVNVGRANCPDGVGRCSRVRSGISDAELSARRIAAENKKRNEAVKQRTREMVQKVGEYLGASKEKMQLVMKAIETLSEGAIKSGSICLEGSGGLVLAVAAEGCVRFDAKGVSLSGQLKGSLTIGGELRFSASVSLTSESASSDDPSFSTSSGIGVNTGSPKGSIGEFRKFAAGVKVHKGWDFDLAVDESIEHKTGQLSTTLTAKVGWGFGGTFGSLTFVSGKWDTGYLPW